MKLLGRFIAIRMGWFETAAIVGIVACGGSQVDPIEATRKEVKQEATVASDSATTLAIADGSAKGSKVELPVNALEEGSTVAIDLAEQPGEFESANSEVAQASSPVVITAANASGAPVSQLNQPMDILLPYSGNFALALAVEKNADNLCAFLKTETGLFVWRKTSIEVDSEASTAKFSSINLGTFQLAFCGAETLNGFKEADESGTIEGSSTLTLKVDSAVYGYGLHHFCAGLLTGTEVDGQEAKFVAASSHDITGSEVELGFEFPLSEIPDDEKAELAVLVQDGSTECNFVAGETVGEDTEINYSRLFSFYLSKDDLKSGASGTLGSDRYAFQSLTLQTGAPSGTVSQITPTPAKNVCVMVESGDDHFTEISTSIDTNGKFEGADSLTFLAKSGAANSDISVSVRVGEACSNKHTSTFDSNSEPYTIRLKTPVSSTYYMTSVSMKIEDPTGGTGTACLQLHNTGSTAGTFVGQWAVTPNQTYGVFLPWDNTAVNDSGDPLYYIKLLLDSATCSTDGITPIDLTDRPLNENFTASAL